MSQDEQGCPTRDCPACGQKDFDFNAKFEKPRFRKGRMVSLCKYDSSFNDRGCGYTESEPFPPKMTKAMCDLPSSWPKLGMVERKPLTTRIKRGAFSRLRWLGAGVVLHATPLWDRMAEGTGELVEWVIRLAGMV